MIRLRACIHASLVSALLAACAPGQDLPPLPPTPVGSYRLGPGDQVRIITVGEDPLTGEFRIDDAGRIAVPMLGSIPAGGLNPTQLGEAVRAALVQHGLVRSPSVSVEVIRYRPIFVLGEVNKAGEFPYQPGMTLLSAVALAGGFTYRAVEDRASVVRVSNGRSIEWRADRGTLLQPGDVVTVFERRF
jgi:polysaccharide export outer membrane protein